PAPPVISAPADVILQCPVTDTGTNITGVAVAQDTCGSVVEFSYSDIVSNGCGGTKVVSRTWTATDDSGNSTNVVQTITVRDTTPPSITCAANKTVECASTWTFDAPTATDTCGTATIAILGTVTNTTGKCCGTFDATRTWRATDACGNTAVCSQTVTVADHTPPTLTLNGAGEMTVECHSKFTDPGAKATDACAGDLTGAVITTGVVNTNLVGRYTLTYRVTDPSGNSASTSRTVTVVPGIS